MIDNFSLKPMILVIPVLLALVFIELGFAYLKGRKVYNFQDSITSINIGLLSQFVNSTGAVFGAVMYALIEARYGTFEWSTASPFTWIFALLLYDFLYYWVHRTGHMVNIFWAAHITHHSSEEFNLSTAMRQASTGFYFKWVFYLPLAVLGIPVEVYVIVGLVDLLYQFWVHTRLIGRLGFLEWFLVTPSNHRVHHGQNDYCIDRNFGGIFCLWDRLFGTYADEREEEPIVYGIRKPLQSWSPVWSNLHYYETLWLKVKNARSWREGLMFIVAEPDWSPADTENTSTKSPTVDSYQKHRSLAPTSIRLSSIATTLVSLTLLILYLGTRDQMLLAQQLIFVAIVIGLFAGIGKVWSLEKFQAPQHD